MRIKRILGSLSLSLLLAVQIPMTALAVEDLSPTETVPVAHEEVAPSSASAPAPVEEEHPDKPGYVFNDATGKWEAADLDSFAWSDDLGRWNSPLYWYDTQVGWYHLRQAASPVVAPSIAPTNEGVDNNAVAQAVPDNDPANNNTGPGSTNNANSTTRNSLMADVLNRASITNFDNSNALSGSANVALNTLGGNAATGAATVVKNLFNMINSMWSWSRGAFNYFTLNIFGDHRGDINIDTPRSSGRGGSIGGLPACTGGVNSNSNTGPLSTNNASTDCQNDATVNNRSSGSITNNVDLLAQSGDANVQGNNRGGDATSGDATAELNIVNMINSTIGAGDMFFGIINIYGNLDGDILFPGLSLDDAIGSSTAGASASNTNTGAGSNNNTNSTGTNNTNLNNSASGAFNNNIDAEAQSGDANVTRNTSAGSATTGSAETNTSEFNLFNMNIFGENAVLVIVNDMGRWVGRIMNLPSGSNGGLLTSNATVTNNNTGAGSNNNATDNSSNNATINNDTSGTITNNVRSRAVSGDANVSDNTTAGNARSGNTRAATNVANIFGSNLGFSGLFGILFVNVFGSWTGSVGIDTAAGSLPAGTALAAATSSINAASFGSSLASAYATSSASQASGSGGPASGATGGGVDSNSIASQTEVPSLVAANAQLRADQAGAKSGTQATATLFILTALVLFAAGGLVGVERKLKPRG